MFRICACLLALVASMSSGLLAAQAPKPAQPPAPARPAQRRPATPPPPPAKPVAKPVVKPPEPPKRVPPDVQLVTQYVTGDARTTSTVQLKGARARFSLGDTLASIQQCDAKQAIQLNTQTRTYLAVPFDASASAPAATAESRKKGGEVIYTTTVTDTGETQPMFGFTAKHLKTVVAKDFTPSACDKKPQKVEIDGWYIDLPAALTCTSASTARAAVQVDPQHPECVDNIQYLQPQTRVGYPVKYTSVATAGDEPPVTTTMEVSELERTDVAASAVEVPTDYVAVRSVQQLTADHRPGEAGTKKPGVMRVGLMPIANKSGSKFEMASLDDALLESFSDTDLDIVRLTGATQGALEADAKAKDVDLLLSTTISEVKTPRGGIVGKVAGTSGDAFTARVDYTIAAPGQAKPRNTGSERSGGSTLNSAITIAKKVVQFAPPVMMAKYGYMNAYGSMLNGGGPTGAMRQTPDPVMDMAFSLLDRATGNKAPEQFSTEEGAVASALEKEIKSVVSDLAKKK